VLAPLTRLQPSADAPASVDMGLVVRAVQSLLLHCPISALERAGHDHVLAELGHRCRIAFDSLTAFVARNSSPQRPALVAAATAYAEGRLSVDDVAMLLGLAVPDAVALLEEQGFRRSPDDLRLDDESRQQRLLLIRRERTARQGVPEASPGGGTRDGELEFKCPPTATDPPVVLPPSPSAAEQTASRRNPGEGGRRSRNLLKRREQQCAGIGRRLWHAFCLHTVNATHASSQPSDHNPRGPAFCGSLSRVRHSTFRDTLLSDGRRGGARDATGPSART